MSNIRVDTTAMDREVTELQGLSRELQNISSNIGRVRQSLTWKISISSTVKKKLNSYSQYVDTLASRSYAMSTTLEKIKIQYIRTETGNKNAVGDGSSHGYEVESIAFDDDGSYGGDQGHMRDVYYWDPLKCWELLSYLREYYPHMSILRAFQYFSRLNSVGCGYVAMANTLFLEYEGRPEEFERTFGYPMYKDGDLNYDRLILDIYATTDLANINDASDGLPQGTIGSTRAEIMQMFLEEKGVMVTTEANANVTVDNFRDIVESGGHVVLGYWYSPMYDGNGNRVYIDGGHAMTVTGVTEDGRFIVSSWGDKYYINPSDLGSDDSFMVFYYNS